MPTSLPLPRVLEIKRTLAGRERRFDCRVLLRTGAHLVVLFVAEEAMHVHGVDLPAGTVTFGHFWPARPYNVYHWLDQTTGLTIGAYVNLCEETRLGDATLEWLDLAIDILALPGLPPRVLDEDEIPGDATPALRDRIGRAKATALGGLPALLEELERFRTDLWPRARGVLDVP